MSTYLFICWGLFNYFQTMWWPLCIHPVLPRHFPLLKLFLEATWCSNSGLRSLYPATMVGQRASFGPCPAFTVAQLTIWSGPKYYMITGVTHNYYRLVLISNPFIAKWVVRRTRPRVNCAGVCSPRVTTEWGGTGWYLLVLGRYRVVLFDIWRHWVSRKW